MDDRILLLSLDAFLRELNSVSFRLDAMITEVTAMRDDIIDRIDDSSQLPLPIVALPPSNRWAS